MESTKCVNCSEEIEGRVDKIFCTPYCKSAFHYQKNKRKEKSTYKTIDDTLKRNRRLLAHYNKAGKAVIRKEELLKTGFNPNYFTHYWKNSSGDVYLFCYEYGFLARTENNKSKYVLVHWQDDMEKK